MYQFFIGIDISKHDFAVAIKGSKKTEKFENNLSGFKKLFSAYQDKLISGLTVLETTGGYELGLIDFLLGKNCSVHRADTRKVKYFIKSLGTHAKTDAIDAVGLAQYAEERQLKLKLYKPNPQHKLLKLVQRRIELKQMLVQEKNRRQAPDQGGLATSFNFVIKAIEKEIKRVEEVINKVIKDNALINQKMDILKTINGIGEVISIELLALLPELGHINRKRIASLAGVAPHPYESGAKQGYRRTKGGRKEVKPVLFMAAMTASRSKSRLGDFYRRLVEAGKKKMVALTAVMRKILVIANAKVRDYVAENGCCA